MEVVTRVEQAADLEAIRTINRRAFGSDDEARLVDALRSQGYLRLSLVAEVAGQTVGHVLFSDLPIETDRGRVASLALAPVAVLPEFQNRGVGSRLIRQGLDECRRQGHRIVIVLGHPAYYPRFGFSAELARPLDSPYAGDSFMALELVVGALAAVKGRVEYPPPFGGF
jgi:putative acetyltransferase